MNMQNLLEKIAEWQKVVQDYDVIVHETASTILELDTARKIGNKRSVINLEADIKNQIQKLKEQNDLLEAAQEMVVNAIVNSSSENNKQALLQLAMQPPDFAGLDELFTESHKPSTLVHLHEIYISHVSMIVEKMQKYLKKVAAS